MPAAWGVTPALIAAQRATWRDSKHWRLALYLGAADVDIAMDDGTTPVLIASQNGHTDVLTMLY
jgi:hypothetical protein